MLKFNRHWCFYLLACLTLFYSCSSNQRMDNGASHPFQTFKIEEQFSQFKERPADHHEIDSNNEPKKTSATPDLAKPTVVSIKKKKKVIVKNNENKDAYPAEYPLELKEINKKYNKIWQQFHPSFSTNEVITLKVKFLGMSVGHFILTTMPKVMVGDKLAYVFKGHLKSEKYYEMLYSLDDIVESVVAIDNFVPIKFLMTQRESKKILDELHLFDHQKLTFHYWYKRIKNNTTNEHKLNGFLPSHFQDFLSSIYFLRGLPLKVGNHIEFPVMNKGKVSISIAHVIGIETIEINGKKYEAIKVRATNNFPSSKQQKGELEFWFLNDHTKKLLRLKGNVKIGNIEAEIVQ